jgi:hypothetical protein
MILPTIDNFTPIQQKTRRSDRFFDPSRVPTSSNAWTLVQNVIKQIENYEAYCQKRQRKRRAADQATFEATVTALVCDLAHVALTGHTAGVAVPRSNQILGSRSCYSHTALNKKLPDILDTLSRPELDFLVQVRGSANPFGRGQQTLVFPSERLREHLQHHQVRLNDISGYKERPTIVLKAIKEDHRSKGLYKEYEETETVRRYRHQVETINQWLAEADIDFDDTVLKTSRAIDINERHLRRIFTRGSFESGARLFGGFWQELKKEERLRGLTIEGEPVTCLDYGQIGPRLLYGLERAYPLTEDLYSIPGLEWCREGIKKLMNALLFSDGVPSRKPQGTAKKLPKHQSVQELTEVLRHAHPAIAHHFGTQVGHHVQFLESEILVEVLLRLRDQGVIALPIHDAFVVSWSKKDLVRNVMMEVFEEMTSIEAIITEEE